MSTGEAAALASCHPTTILRAIQRGELEAVRLGRHGDYRVEAAAVRGLAATGALRGETVHLKTVFGPFSDERFVAGASDAQRRARDEIRHQRRLRVAKGLNAPELRREDLEFGRYQVTHTPTGDTFTVIRGEVVDALFAPPIAAYWVAGDGSIGFLEARR